MKKVGIIGTGNIGTDLLIKLCKLGYKDIAFVGRNDNESKKDYALKFNGIYSSESINFFIKNPKYDVVFDCTNAADACSNYEIFKSLDIKVIDLTPAKIGQICVPSINQEVVKNFDNLNLVTCGGQASLPFIKVINEFINSISYIEVVSQISSKSAGMSTRINIDNYIETTEYAIKYFSNTKNCKVILNINPAEPCVDMQTTIFVEFEKNQIIDFENLVSKIYSKLLQVKEYVPFYELIIPPMLTEEETLMMSVKVKGQGDFLPKYAGNLDIINCAAIRLLENL